MESSGYVGALRRPGEISMSKTKTSACTELTVSPRPERGSMGRAVGVCPGSSCFLRAGRKPGDVWLGQHTVLIWIRPILIFSFQIFCRHSFRWQFTRNVYRPGTAEGVRDQLLLQKSLPLWVKVFLGDEPHWGTWYSASLLYGNGGLLSFALFSTCSLFCSQSFVYRNRNCEKLRFMFKNVRG